MNPQTFIIKFATNDKNFEKHKDICIKDNSIGVNFGIILPLNTLSSDEIGKVLDGAPLGRIRQMKTFICDLKIGDIIWAMQGREKVLYAGVVTSNCYFTSDPGFLGFNHRRHVDFTICPEGSEIGWCTEPVKHGGYLNTIQLINDKDKKMAIKTPQLDLLKEFGEESRCV